jgi:hypothetical protein
MAPPTKSAAKTKKADAPAQKKLAAATNGKVKKPAKASAKPAKSILKNGTKKSVKFAKRVASAAGDKKVKRKRKSSKKAGYAQRFKFDLAPLRSDLLPEERVAGATAIK